MMLMLTARCRTGAKSGDEQGLPGCSVVIVGKLGINRGQACLRMNVLEMI